MYDEVLIPTDGSESARRATEHGVGLARRYGATVHALYAIDLRHLGGDADEFTDVSAVENALEEEGERAVEAVVERAAASGLDTETTIARGIPSRVIADQVSEGGADLVAMGTHGRTGVERFLIGSVAERVVRSSPAPVLTSRPGEGDPDTDYDDVLVPTDGSPAAERAVERAVDLAERYGATVHALSVTDERFTRPPLDEAFETIGADAVRAAAERATERGVPVETDVVAGVPAERIVERAGSLGCDLVSMGTNGRTGLDRIVLGSVAERVVRRAPCPVVTTRRAEADAAAEGRQSR